MGGGGFRYRQLVTAIRAPSSREGARKRHSASHLGSSMHGSPWMHGKRRR